MAGIPIKWVDQDGNVNHLDELLVLDSLSKTLIFITDSHHRIHIGESFTVNAVDETLANTDTIIISFKTPSLDREVHMFLFFSTLVGGSLELWEGVTWDTNTGTATAIINRKRDLNPLFSGMLEDKTDTPRFTATGNILVNPTNLGTGSAVSLDKQYAWGERGKVGAGFLRDEHEFILMPDTQYAVVFTAIGGSNKAQVTLNWHELINKHNNDGGL